MERLLDKRSTTPIDATGRWQLALENGSLSGGKKSKAIGLARLL